MTNAIQKLIEWQAEDPKQREWSIRQWDSRVRDANKAIRIRLTDGNFHVERAVPLIQVQDATFDVLYDQVQVVVAMLAMGESSKQEIRHGETCQKASHISEENLLGMGWFHSQEDDGPYYIATKRYCGRCHDAL